MQTIVKLLCASLIVALVIAPACKAFHKALRTRKLRRYCKEPILRRLFIVALIGAVSSPAFAGDSGFLKLEVEDVNTAEVEFIAWGCLAFAIGLFFAIREFLYEQKRTLQTEANEIADEIEE